MRTLLYDLSSWVYVHPRRRRSSVLTAQTVLWILIVVWTMPAAASRLSVFVSVAPQRYLLERIGGDHVDVSVLVRPGHSPATYEPTPKQMTALMAAELYVRIGVPFEDAWMGRIEASNPKLIVVDARDGIPLREMTRHHDAHAMYLPRVARKDPHIWLSPPLALKMSTRLLHRLSEFDPHHRTEYEKNYRLLAANLEQLDHEIRTLLLNLEQRSFMVFHPAWGYFADTYGLQQVPIEVEGKEPGPRSLARLIDLAKAHRVRTVFVDSRISQKHAATVAHAIDARLVSVDPLAEDYAQNLRRVARILASVNQ